LNGSQSRHVLKETTIAEWLLDRLSPQLTTAFFTPQSFYRAREDWKHIYGYGNDFAVNEAGNILFAEKEGIYVGASAMIRHYPEQGINVVILSNMQMSA